MWIDSGIAACHHCGASALKTEKADAANKNLAISIANDYVNIRNKPSLHGKIKGRLYRGSAVTITKTYKNGWALIKSGSFRGYIKKNIWQQGQRHRNLQRNMECSILPLKRVFLH